VSNERPYVLINDPKARGISSRRDRGGNSSAIASYRKSDRPRWIFLRRRNVQSALRNVARCNDPSRLHHPQLVLAYTDGSSPPLPLLLPRIVSPVSIKLNFSTAFLFYTWNAYTWISRQRDRGRCYCKDCVTSSIEITQVFMQLAALMRARFPNARITVTSRVL